MLCIYVLLGLEIAKEGYLCHALFVFGALFIRSFLPHHHDQSAESGPWPIVTDDAVATFEPVGIMMVLVMATISNGDNDYDDEAVVVDVTGGS
jgi:hypothetical protein